MTVEVGLVLFAELVEVGLDSIVLVAGTLPVVGEAAGGEESSSLIEVAGRADRGDKGAGSGVLGLELGSVLAVVGKAGRASTRVTGRENDRDTAAAELSEQVADAESVRLGYALLVLAVRGRDDLGKVLLRELEHALEELKVGLVGAVRLIGLVEISDPRAASTSAVFSNRQGLGKTKHVLQIQVGLATVVGRGLIVQTAVELDNRKVLTHSLGQDILLKEGKVAVARVLLEVGSKCCLAAALGVGSVVNLVELLQALGSDRSITVNSDVGRRSELDAEDLALSLVVRADSSETSGRLNEVDVPGNLIWNGVLERAENLARRALLADEPGKLGSEELVGNTDGGLEGYPVGISLEILDTGGLEPGRDRGNGLLAGHEHALHLLVRLKVLSVLCVRGGGDVHDGLLKACGIALLERDLELERVRIRCRALKLPSCWPLALIETR